MTEVREVITYKADLKKMLKESGISLNQLAKMTGIDPAYLSRAKHGKISLSMTHWDKIKIHIKPYELKEIKRQ